MKSKNQEKSASSTYCCGIFRKFFDSKTYFSLDLCFKDKSVEKEYRNLTVGYLKNYFSFFNAASFLTIIFFWLINPVENQNFRGAALIFYLLSAVISFVMLIYFRTRKYFKYPDYGILFFQLLVTTGYVESNRFNGNILYRFTSANFMISALTLEAIILISMILRCPWKINLFGSLNLNIYLYFRFINFTDDIQLKPLPAIILAINFFFVTLGTYFNEKYDRGIFYKRYQDEQSLKRFEKLIKELIPSSIIILRSDDIIFHNNEAGRILGVKEDFPIEKMINKILISSNGIKEENNALLNFQIDTENPINVLDDNNCKDIKAYAQEFIKSKDQGDFLRLTGTISSKNLPQIELGTESNFKKYFNIHMGIITWKNEDAVMAIITEDFAAQRIFDIQEQAQYKDKLLATVSHDLRTPLNGVIGILDLALERNLDKSLRKR